MGYKGSSYFRIFLLVLIISFTALLGVCDYYVPNAVSGCILNENSNIGGIIMLKESTDGESAAATLFGLPVKSVAVNTASDSYVYLGGDTLGVKIHTGGVMVVGINDGSSPASTAGLKKGDFIIKANSVKTDTVEKFQKLVSQSGGKAFEITYIRDGREQKTTLVPKADEYGAYKAGMWIRDSTAGIGTVTYVTKDGIFASLGHGISDADTGMLMPLSRGTAVKISVDYAVKGKPNVPGELKGSFSVEKEGDLVSNTSTGLYGAMNLESIENRKLIKLGSKNELHTGKAQIIASVDPEGAKYYDIEISQIVKGSDDGKNFLIEVTDEELIEKTGGIVQGMSGSPIIQDGKLVGAVTHVLVGDPAKGYGIFIENMYKNMPSVKK